MKLVSLLCVFSLLMPIQLHAATGAVAAKQLIHQLESYKHFKTSFIQTLQNDRGEQLHRTQGNLLFDKPDHFRWSVVVPTEQTIVADGKTLWLYDAELEQVIIQKQKGKLDSAFVTILTKRPKDIQRQYRIEAHKNQQTTLYQLTPVNSQSPIRKIELGFRSNILSFIYIKDKLGQQTNIRFSQLETKEKVNKKEFTFTIPVNTDIIDQRKA